MTVESTRRERRIAATRVTEAQTPTVRHVWRTGRFWLALLAIAGLVVLITAALRGGNSEIRGEMDPQSAAPAGSQAIVSVLRDHGVTVIIAESAAEVTAAAGANATLMLHDPLDIVASRDGDGAVAELAGGFGHTVVVSPSYGQFREFDSDASNAGYHDAESAVSGTCSVTGESARLSVGALLWPGAGQGCFGDETDGYAIVVGPDGTVFLGDGTPLRNDTLAAVDNAAVMIHLLGSSPTLVWYQPQYEDTGVTDETLIARSTPSWVVPTTTLALVTLLVAMYWRGRRFGALVPERLPVTVPSDETMRGRGRLYQRIGAHDQALRALRVGTRERLARSLGLPGHSTAEAVALAVAARLGRDPEPLRAALATGQAGGERDLLHYAAILEEAEFALGQALDPRTTTTTSDTATAKEKP